MTASIPASILSNVVPGVLSAGGNPLSLNAVFITSDPSIPIGTAQAFDGTTDVNDWFGINAPEAVLAGVYFSGFTNCTVLPGTLYFVQQNTAPVAAYLRGASVEAITLAQLQAFSGTITVSINGQVNTSAAINLAGATSFSNAASLITAGLQSATAVFNGTGSQTADVVTITATASGSLAIGDILAGAGVLTDSVIESFGTYTPTAGTGTVNVSTSGTVASGTVTVAGLGVATYDTLRSAFVITSPTTGAGSTIAAATDDSLSPLIYLTAATGAVTSQGAAAQTPAQVMAGVVAATQNWATFMTVTEQTLSNKQAFAAWVQTNGQPNRYLYVCQDSDPTPTQSPAAEGSFGYIVNAANYTGVMPVYDTSGTGVLAALQCAITASINFEAENGRTTFAFRGQGGLVAQITDETVYENLVANGYNCYASFATASQQFTQNQPGQISGPFKWADAYVNQIYFNAAFQQANMILLTTVPAVPYVTRGYNLIRGALLGPIGDMGDFGAWVAGVTLSSTQAAAINSATNDPNAAATLQTNGWYLQILDPGSIVRGNRGTPVINFYYTDGGSVQKISMSSVDVQ